MTLALRALPLAEIERYLERHRPEWKPEQRALVATLSQGAIGPARNFNLSSYADTRRDALTILETALGSRTHSELFRVTETYRAGAEGREKMDRLIGCLYSLLEDLLFLEAGSPALVRNTVVVGELEKLAQAADFEWLSRASERLAEVERGLRRNLLRLLSLDVFEAALEKPGL